MKWFGIIFLLVIYACGSKQIKFEKSKWNKKIDGFYIYREVMYEDLVNNHLKRGMPFYKIKDLMGDPDNLANLDNYSIGYIIKEDYDGIDPVETKILLIKLTRDSLVKKVTVVDIN